MDDLAIHTKRKPGESEKQHQLKHRKYVHHILDILQKHDLYLKPEKCSFEQEEIDSLGVIVGKDKVEMDPQKLSGVADWPVPKNPTDVRSFLRFTGYYRYFVPNYSKVARPLLDLTKKNLVSHWGEPQFKAFEMLKTLMCRRPVLIQSDFDRRIYLQTDTSDYGIGAVLSQEQGERDTPPDKK